MLNSLVEAFDAAAERHGVEQVRSMQDNGLLATCGLVVPRVDHASRTIAFARNSPRSCERFNDQHDAAAVDPRRDRQRPGDQRAGGRASTDLRAVG